MCGLWGGIGQGINPHIVRTLGVLNENRGRQSAGFFNSKGGTLKIACSIKEFLRYKELKEYMDNSVRETWALCGHTRQSTRGAITTANAHPFNYKTITGSHNGSVWSAPNSYTVDSEWLFDKLSDVGPGEYQAALGDVPGWYALTWHDSRNGRIYLLNYNGSLCFNRVKGVVYYSSVEDDLHTATGKKADKVLAQGEVWCFDGTKGKQLETFTGPAVRTWTRSDDEPFVGTYGGQQTRTAWMNGYRVEYMRPFQSQKFTGRVYVTAAGDIFGFYNDNVWRPLWDQRGSRMNVKWEQDMEEMQRQQAIAKGEANLLALISQEDTKIETIPPPVGLTEGWTDADWEKHFDKKAEQQEIADHEAMTPEQLKTAINDAELQRNKELVESWKEVEDHINEIKDPIVREKVLARHNRRVTLALEGMNETAITDKLVQEGLIA